MTAVSRNVQASYDSQYQAGASEWRELGARDKAANILALCGSRRFPRVLDCGAGDGSILQRLHASQLFQEFTAIDISETGIEAIRARRLAKIKEVRKFDGYRIPFADRAFDLAVCSHVIEHVEHPRVLLREIRRVSTYQVFEVPLDYSIGVDRSTAHLLSYGHINVFTPSLFRFLLKSEGFEILDDRLTQLAPDVVRFNWSRSSGQRKALARELRLRMAPLRNALKRLVYGRRRYEEFSYLAYTCLTSWKGELKIFQGER